MNKFEIRCTIFFVIIVSFLEPAQSWWLINRRRCSATNCQVSSWSNWSPCSDSCGLFGTKIRTRYKTASESCGGGCFSLSEQVPCNVQCCPEPCVYEYSAWGSCQNCGEHSFQQRTQRLTKQAQCGGACPSPQTETRKCPNAPCCPKDCVIGQWGSWSQCDAACDQVGTQTRSRSLVQPSCNGKTCPSATESVKCNGPCCAKNCLFTDWTSWGDCKEKGPGICATNTGTKTRTRTITRQSSCGGLCDKSTDTAACTPQPLSCILTNWGLWSTCQPTNGKCGQGTKSRSRSITQQPFCSQQCESLTDTQTCVHSCCPVDCGYTNWGLWSNCSNECGTGMQTRTRQVQTSGTCGGVLCQQKLLSETMTCANFVNINCVTSTWTSWSTCDNGCGSGKQIRTRTITQQPKCRGMLCGDVKEETNCTSFREKTDCQVSDWGIWGPCSDKCSVGTRKRVRFVTTNDKCFGKQCPNLEHSEACGNPNGGCQQSCLAGTCGCHSGFEIHNATHCIAKNCGRLLPSICPVITPDTPFNDIGQCKEAILTCPGDSSSFPVSCKFSCSAGYTLTGSNSIRCDNSGNWSPKMTSACTRNNHPPTDIILSKNTVNENEAPTIVVGTLTAVDQDQNERHQFTISDDPCNCFKISGAELKTLKTFDYEKMPQKYRISITATEVSKDRLTVSKTFEILVKDVNEKPTDISISNAVIDENSDEDTFVGTLQTVDIDQGQSYVYQLLDSAKQLFKLNGSNLMTAGKNLNCLTTNPARCPLNYETSSTNRVVVEVTDSGYPLQQFIKFIDIQLRDVNDRPYNLSLSSNEIKEDSPAGTLVGNVLANDEDKGQILTYKILSDDNGNFILTGDKLYKTKSSNYETKKTHMIQVEVSDNGVPSLKVQSFFQINILDINEPPIFINLTSASNLVQAVNNTLSLPENTTVGSQLASITIYDNDEISSITVQLNNDSSKFRLSQSNVPCQKTKEYDAMSKCVVDLILKSKVNFEDIQSYKSTVKITDRGNTSYYKFDIFILDSNDKPSMVKIDNKLSASVIENFPGINIGFFSTDDEDLNQIFTYELRDDFGLFQVNDNLLAFKDGKSANFEDINSYTLTIKSTDNGNPSLSTTNDITIRIVDANDKQSGLNLTNNVVNENADVGTVVGKLIIEDPDLLSKTITNNHTCSITNSSQFIIENNILKTYTNVIDYEIASIIYIEVICVDNFLTTKWVLDIHVINQNEAPTDIQTQNNNIPENAASPFFISRVFTIDPDNLNAKTVKQIFTYKFITMNDTFEIENDKLYALRPFDFEQQTKIDVQLMTIDSGSPPLNKTVLLSFDILDENDLPDDIILNNNIVPENSVQNTVIGLLSAVDQDLGQRHRFLLNDSANGIFQINGNKLEVAKPELNYEKQHEYVITIGATDNGSPELTVHKQFTVYVSDVNDPPKNITITNYTLPENSPIGYKIGQLQAMDEDVNQKVTFALVGGPIEHFFIDVNSYLCKKTNFSDFEKEKIYKLQIEGSDNGWPVMKTQSYVVIEIIDENEPPINTIITDDGAANTFNESNPHITENLSVGSVVGTIITKDEDLAAALNVTLDDDSNGFFGLDSKIDCGESLEGDKNLTVCKIKLITKERLNFENTPTHKILVRTTDHGGLHYIQQFTITVIDSNDKPTDILLSGKATASFQENTVGAFIADLSTVDEDVGQSYQYELIGDSKKYFEILQNKIHVKRDDQIDYELQSNFTITLKSTDTGVPPQSVTIQTTIFVEDVNEQPTYMQLTNNTIYENSFVGTIIGTILIDDPDNFGDNIYKQTHACSIQKEGPIAFSISYSSLYKVNRLVLAADVDYEQASKGNVTIVCFDNGKPSLSIQTEFTIFVLDVNENPTDILLSNIDVMENSDNGTTVGYFSTSDPDNYQDLTQKFTYRIMNDVPFYIKHDILKTKAVLDYELQSSYDIQVKSTDSGNPPMQVSKTIKIVIVDLNEPPYAIQLKGTSVYENADKGTVIGLLNALDDDIRKDGSKQQHTFGLVEDPIGAFRIAGNELQVAENNSLCLRLGGKHCKINFENNGFINLKIRAIDDGVPSQSFDQEFVIKVIDVNDIPRNLRLTSNIVPENASLNYVIGDLTVEDEDFGQLHIFSLADDDNGRFIIFNHSLVKAKDTNYETQKSHRIVVTATDNGFPAMTIRQEFHIIVQDINESPTNLRLTSFQSAEQFPDNQVKIQENELQNTVVATVEADDEDTVTDLAFRLVENPNNMFKLDDKVSCQNITATATVNHTLCRTYLLLNKSLNYEDNALLLISISVSDHAGLSHVQSFNITVLDVNDAPTDVTVEGEHLVFVQENLRYKKIGAFETSDEDVNQDFQYKLVDDAGGRFMIQKDLFGIYELHTGSVVVDYETSSNYSIRVLSTDSGVPRKSVEKSIVIQVIDLNENPTDIIVTNNHVKENTPIGTIITNFTVIDPDNIKEKKQVHTCILVKNFNNKFALNNFTLTVKDALDYEVITEDVVTISCLDSGYPRKLLEKTIQIFIDDVNEPPTGLTLSNVEVPENKKGFLIGSFTAVDPDKKDSWTYKFINVIDPSFILDGNQLKTNKMLNYENKTSHYIYVEVVDNGGLGFTYSDRFTITVQDENDPPTDIICHGEFSLHENANQGSLVGECTAVDEDKFQYHIYTITDVYAYDYYDNVTRLSDPTTIFTIGKSTGKIELARQKLDYETHYKYDLTIQAEDSGKNPLAINRNVTVAIINVNQKPTDILLSNNKVNENSPQNTVVGQLKVVDPDNKNLPVQKHICTVLPSTYPPLPFKVDDSDRLIVQSSKLLDYEANPYIQITIQCNEDLDYGFSIQENFTISIMNVNEAPTNISLYPSVINEQNKAGDVVGVIKFYDPDNLFALVDNVTIDDFTTFGAPFKLENSFSLVATQSLDYEIQSSYIVQITLKDNGKPPMTSTQNITIMVGNINDAPTDISLTVTSTNENILPGTNISRLITIDPDHTQTHTYELLDDAGLFKLSGDQLILTGLLDYEKYKSIDIYVKSTDSGKPPLSYQKSLTLNIMDVNEPPYAIDATIFSVPENIQKEFRFGNLKVQDQDKGQRHTCECISYSKDWVRIVTETNGNVSLYIQPDQVKLDYEEKQSLYFEIRCLDDGNPPLANETPLNVPVLDVNEAPTSILIGNSSIITIDENPIPNQVIGSLQCLDPDVGQSCIYELIGEAQTFFKILPVSNELEIKNFTQLNYEAPPGVNSFTFMIKATDNGKPPLSVTSSITILSNDVNEAPTNVSLIHGSLDIKEDASKDTHIGQLWSNNPEGFRQTVSYKLLNYQNIFKIVSTHKPASVSFLTLQGDLYSDIQSKYIVDIEAIDDGLPPLSSVGTFTLNILKSTPCRDLSIVCEANATCTRHNKTTAICVCLPGFKQFNDKCIQINDCQPQCMFCIGSHIQSCKDNTTEPCSPCQNGGVCTDHHLNYTCQCKPGYNGHDCSNDIDDCASNPCAHDSTCVDGINNYTCICRSGYTGFNCSTDINECQSEPCYQGTCNDLVNGFQCNCPNEYFGTRCDRETGQCSESKCNPTLETCAQGKQRKSLEVVASSMCIPNDLIVGLSFPASLAPIGGTNETLFRLHFETFLLDTVTIPLPWIQPDSSTDFKAVRMSDTLILKYENAKKLKKTDRKRKRRDSDDTHTRVHFFGTYQSKVIQPNVLLFSINETCEELFNDCTIKNNYFSCQICKAVSAYLQDNTLLKRPLIERSIGDDRNSKFMGILPYLAGGLCLLLIILIVGVGLRCRQKRQKRFKSKNSPEVQCATDLDTIRKRSRLRSDPDSDNFDGHFNPVYGVNEDEVDESEATGVTSYEPCNPADVFGRSTFNKIVTKKQGKMFENPVFGLTGTEGTYDETHFNNENGLINPFFVDQPEEKE